MYIYSLIIHIQYIYIYNLIEFQVIIKGINKFSTKIKYINTFINI